MWHHLTPRAEETRGGSGVSVLLMAGKSQEELLFQGLQVPKMYPDLSFPLPPNSCRCFPGAEPNQKSEGRGDSQAKESAGPEQVRWDRVMANHQNRLGVYLV